MDMDNGVVIAEGWGDIMGLNCNRGKKYRLNFKKSYIQIKIL